MTTDTEVQATFDRLMESARKLGAGMAEVVITGAPPPWDQDWFLKVRQNVIDCAGISYRKEFPAYPEVLILNLQIRVKEGFESRILELASNGPLQGGAA